MQSVDLNLLVVLDALLQEGSVAGAARRLHLSAPAVSRSLGRLRKLLGDPLLVRTGRTLTPTPVAEELRERAHQALADAYDVLGPLSIPSDQELEARLDRGFTIRVGPDNATAFGPALLAEVRRRAPRARVNLIGDSAAAAADLRDGRIDLSLGSPVAAGREHLHREKLLIDAVVIVARIDGSFATACAGRAPTVDDLAGQPHVVRVPRSAWHDVADSLLVEQDRRRTVVATAPGFAAAFAMVRDSDLVCLAPDRLTRTMRRPDLGTWPCPITLPDLIIEQSWHHRSNADPEHRWLRARVRTAVSASMTSDGTD